MSENRPRRKTDILAKDIGGEMLLYSDTNEAVHVLHGVAGFIWERCDGRHTPDDIEFEIRAEFSVPGDADVASDVRITLTQFAQKGLLIESA